MACLCSAGTNTKKIACWKCFSSYMYGFCAGNFIHSFWRPIRDRECKLSRVSIVSQKFIGNTNNVKLVIICWFFFYFCRMSQLLIHWLHSFWYFLYRSKCLIFLVSHFFQVLHYLSWFTFCYFLLLNTIIEMLREQTTHRMKIGWNYRHKRNYWKAFRKFSRRRRQRLLVLQKNRTKVDIAFFSRFVFFFVWCYQLSFEQRITRNSMAWIWTIA